MRDFDVIIAGGGIAGASLAASIGDRRRVAIVEAEHQCGYHSTGRSAAFYLESYGGPIVAPLTKASEKFLTEPPREFAPDGFLRQRGALHLSRGTWPDVPPQVAVRRIERPEMESLVPGLRPEWRTGLFEPGCADIDVAALHAAYLSAFKRAGGKIILRKRLERAEFVAGRWRVLLDGDEEIGAAILVNAAGAWADDVAERCAVRPIGIAPKRRTMVQLRVGRTGLKTLPLVDDAEGSFYFKGESDSSVWLSPHDEIATDPCDAAPEEIDVATAIARFEQVVDWPVERVERRWAGLRSFAPDRVPVYGYDPEVPQFFWCAGQGGFGIQTAPAASSLAASVLLDEGLPAFIAHIEPTHFSPRRFAR